MSYELVMTKRDSQGKPSGEKISITSLRGSDLHEFYEKNRRKAKNKKKH